MSIEQVLKTRYDKLSRQDKEIIGSALIKVNMGVGLPADHRAVATFIKGTGLVAKTGELDSIIQFLHGSDSDKKRSQKNSGGTETIARPDVSLGTSAAKSMGVFREDAEITVKERQEKK